METKKSLLSDMVIMRVIAVVFLITFHALAPFNHSWIRFNGFIEIPVYQYLADFVYVIFLAVFVFISGYIFAYQVYQRGRVYTFGKLVGSKAKRLILPAILFGIVYIALFWENISFNFKLFESIVSGVGHLWFMPMLFWCFIFGWLIDKIKINEWLKIAGLYLLTFLAALPDHFGLVDATRWLVYFYVGMQVSKHKDAVMNWLNYPKSISLLCIFLFVFVFCESTYPVLDKLGENNKFWLGVYYFVKRTGVFMMSLSVCMGLFGVLNTSKSSKNTPPPARNAQRTSMVIVVE